MSLRRILLACTAMAALGLPGAPSFAQGGNHCIVPDAASRTQIAAATASYEEAEPPLWHNLGAASYKVTTRSAAAQAFFDQGLRLSYGFNHAEARRAFRKAQRLDPSCAMCFWGEALVLGPNINAPMMPEAQAPAFAALQQAQGLAGGATAREQALIGALAKRYAAEAPDNRAPLDMAYAQAMAATAAAFPEDDDIAVLAAEALMDTQPWDYWQEGGHEPKGSAATIQRLLETVLARSPAHAGAIHLYIHLVEASDRPERAEPYADKLAALMPGAGHIVHMPSHIYYRVGRYLDSLKANQDAEAVDEKYLAETGAVGVYPLGYYSHNIHFTLISAQLLGEKDIVLASATELDRHLSNDIVAAVPIAQPIKAAPYFAWAQYGDPDAVLALPQPAGAPPYVEAMWHYARGIALAAKQDLEAAKLEAGAIEALEKNSDWATMDAWYIPARQVLKVAREVVMGRIAQAQGDSDGAIAQLEAAANTQDTLPYMEPPFWYYPVRQSLGAALLQAGKTEKAIEQFNAALAREANSPFALYGLMEAAKARGDAAAAAEAEAKVKQLWKGDSAFLNLGRL